MCENAEDIIDYMAALDLLFRTINSDSVYQSILDGQWKNVEALLQNYQAISATMPLHILPGPEAYLFKLSDMLKLAAEIYNDLKNIEELRATIQAKIQWRKEESKGNSRLLPLPPRGLLGLSPKAKILLSWVQTGELPLDCVYPSLVAACVHSDYLGDDCRGEGEGLGDGEREEGQNFEQNIDREMGKAGEEDEEKEVEEEDEEENIGKEAEEIEIEIEIKENPMEEDIFLDEAEVQDGLEREEENQPVSV